MAKKTALAITLVLLLASSFLVGSVYAGEGIFGKDDVDSTGMLGTGYLGGSIYTLTEDGTLYNIGFYGNGYTTGGTAKAAIYSVSSGNPDALLYESANLTLTSTLQWWNWTVDWYLAAGDYALMVAFVGGGNGVWYRLTSQPSGSSHYRTVTYNSLPDPFGAHTDGTVFYDIYANYTTEEEIYVIDLIVASPENTTYDETIPVSLSTTGNDTNPVYSWNVKFTNGSWLYETNKTVTSYTMEIYENQTNCLFACTVIGDNLAEDYEEVYFSVLYIPVDAWDSDLNNYFCVAILLVFGFVFMVFMVSRRRY